MLSIFKSRNKQKSANKSNASDIIAKTLQQHDTTGHNGAAPPHTADNRLQLHSFLIKRDWIGAITIIEHTIASNNSSNKENTSAAAGKLTGGTTDINVLKQQLAWVSYHASDYDKCIQLYTDLLYHTPDATHYHLCVAACLYYTAQYKQCVDTALKYNKKNVTLSNTTEVEYYNSLQVRLLFHASHKLGDEAGLARYHSLLQPSSIVDQLSLASMHYIRYHYQESTDIYKSILLSHRQYLAIQVYVALCYYKLDYYDVSLELLLPYLTQHTDSAIGINLKACNTYKLYDGTAAENELKSILEQMKSQSITTSYESDLINHNLVVFRRGHNALGIWPNLTDMIPEAKLNLIIYYLRTGDLSSAFDLTSPVEPTTPSEYIVKAIVYTVKGQLEQNDNYIKNAQQLYQLVGASSSECDTIPGRQCMASCYFLLRQYDDVLIYLSSVKQYSEAQCEFQWNYALTCASSSQPNWMECNQALLQIQQLPDNTDYLNNYTYLSWLCKSYIQTSQPDMAWQVYANMTDNQQQQYQLLHLLANECYTVGQFYTSAKAFDMLERLDSGNNDYWDGKRGAICGVLQQVCAGKENKQILRECVKMLGSNAQTPQAEFISRIIQKYCVENGVRL